MTNEISIACKTALKRHRDAALWRNLWTILLFAFGAAVVVFLVLAVLFFLRQDWLPAALTTLGTIVEGVGIKWVADRRAEAVKEEEEAYEEVDEECKDTTAPDSLRANLMLFGRFH
ncbi:MAG: hypothetical protein JRI46_04000 [Deltaproteobacteria bacterium]|nr:hypothetical protein [Deltaproteobacteria bacterium]